jgi:hypothetical protein
LAGPRFERSLSSHHGFWQVMVMASHSFGRSWLWQVMFMTGHCYGRSWLWQVMVMAGHGYGRSWLWQVMVMAGHGYGMSWLWQVMVMAGNGYGRSWFLHKMTMIFFYNLQCFQARNLSTHIQEFLKIIADSTINMRLKLQYTKGLVFSCFYQSLFNTIAHFMQKFITQNNILLGIYVTKINNHNLICHYNLHGNSSAVQPWAWHTLC